GDTPAEPRGTWVAPRKYTVRLTIDGKSLEQPLTVRMDPRVKTDSATLVRVHQMSMDCYKGQKEARLLQSIIQNVRRQIADRSGKADDNLKKELIAFDDKLSALAGAAGGGFGRRGGPVSREASLGRVAGEFASLVSTLQAA